MNEPNNFNHDDQLERAIRALAETPVPDGPPAAVVQSLLAAMSTATDYSKPSTVKRRIITMKSITRTFAAASVLLALGLGLFWILSPGGPNLAFADVADRFLGIQTATCTVTIDTSQTIEMPKLPRGSSKTEALPTGKMEVMGTSKGKGMLMFHAPAQTRIEMETESTFTTPSTKKPRTMKMSTVQIFDGDKGQMLMLTPQCNMAVLTKMENLSEEQKRQNSPFLAVQQFLSAAREHDAKVTPLGEKNINGRPAIGFAVEGLQGFTDTKYWADSKTELPVRVEITLGQGPVVMTMIMTDFQTGMHLDEALFSTKVPEGYAVQNLNLDASTPTIEDLAKMLRILAERNKGVFPDKLPGPNDLFKLQQQFSKDYTKNLMKDITGTLKKEDVAEKNPGKIVAELAKFNKMQKMIDKMMPISRGITFAATLTPANDSHYAGGGVKLDTPNRPIFWYKPTGDSQYEVLHADLSIKKMAKNDLPPVEPPATESEVNSEPRP
ncbi:MAG: hypothetical protein JW719_09635 [Pirellulales bacterium]|nr:hypothetical protein [Pirellulales bacterium]